MSLPPGDRPTRIEGWLEEHPGVVEPGVAQRVRIVAHLEEGGRVSGQRLAEGLGVSRAAVHKHVEALRSLGVDVSSTAGSGYGLGASRDVLAPEMVVPAFVDSGAHGVTRYIYRAEMASTNSVAQEAARAGAPDRTIVVTEHQSAGRGRLGRSWVSEPRADLTFSTVLRPDVAPGVVARFTLATGVAVAETLAAGGYGRVYLKWPNDVLLEGRKVCGILAEAALDMDRIHWVVVGIGLNVNSETAERNAAAVRPEGVLRPVSLREVAGLKIDRAALLARLFVALGEVWGACADERWERVLARYAAFDVLRGHPVEVRSATGAGGGVVAGGVARGLAADGSLLVEEPGGAVRAIAAGEVTLRPRETACCKPDG